MQSNANIHRYLREYSSICKCTWNTQLVKVYKVDIPGYTKIYSGIYMNRGRNVSVKGCKIIKERNICKFHQRDKRVALIRRVDAMPLVFREGCL